MSDHALLTITIPIIKVHIQTKKQMIVKDSDEEKKLLLRNLSNLSVQLIPAIYWMLIYLKTLFLLSLVPWKEYEKKIQRLSISPSTPKVGGKIIVANTLRNIGWLRVLTTESSSKKWSRIPNDPSLTEKFKKSPLKKGDLRNSQTGSTNESCLLLKPSSIMVNHA